VTSGFKAQNYRMLEKFCFYLGQQECPDGVIGSYSLVYLVYLVVPIFDLGVLMSLEAYSVIFQ
jgi:hypothetical protein